MNDEDDILSPRGEMVSKIFHDVSSLIIEMEAMNVEVLSALSSIIIANCMMMGISKASMLSNMSNNWELNDPENDHPLRASSHVIKMNPFI